MKWPSSRNSLPKAVLSWTSTAWTGERNFSYWREDRMKNAQSSVRYSVIAPGAISPGGGLTPSSGRSGILASAMDRLEMRALRTQRGLQHLEHLLGLRRVVRHQVADVDVHRDKGRLGPRVDRDMRFGEQHRARHALRLELEEALAHDGEARRARGVDAQVAPVSYTHL